MKLWDKASNAKSVQQINSVATMDQINSPILQLQSHSIYQTLHHKFVRESPITKCLADQGKNEDHGEQNTRQWKLLTRWANRSISSSPLYAAILWFRQDRRRHPTEHRTWPIPNRSPLSLPWCVESSQPPSKFPLLSKGHVNLLACFMHDDSRLLRMIAMTMMRRCYCRPEQRTVSTSLSHQSFRSSLATMIGMYHTLLVRV